MSVNIIDASVVSAGSVLLIWMVKELWYDKKKVVDSKVDKDVCEVSRNNIKCKLDYIQERVDGIYDKIVNNGGK
jgi:hypothetical protein